MATKLIADIVEAPTIKLTSGAVDGYFLKTDSDGNATWTPISASQVYKGTWDADTNTPTLADSTGVQGHYYRVTTAGTSDLDDSGSSGNKPISYDVGDDVIHNGTFWERIPGVGYTLQTATDAVLGGVKIGNGVSISNGIISVSTDAETLDGFDSTNFVRATGSVVETINGEKTFSNKILIPNGSGIKGSTETGLPGSNSSSFYSFYQSNGTTRKGYIGFPITVNSDLSIRNDASNKSLTLRENGNLNYNGDVIADNFIGNGSQLTDIDYNDLDNLPTILIPAITSNGSEPSLNSGITASEIRTLIGAGTSSADTQLTNEQVQDIIGGMVSANTESNISVTYDDAGGKLNFSSTDTNTQLTNAQVISKVLTNFTAFGTSSNLAATDSILTAFRKLQTRVALNDAKATNSTPTLDEVLTEGNTSSLGANFGGDVEVANASPVFTFRNPDNQDIDNGVELGKILFTVDDNSAGRVREDGAYMRYKNTSSNWGGVDSPAIISFGIRKDNNTFLDDVFTIDNDGNSNFKNDVTIKTNTKIRDTDIGVTIISQNGLSNQRILFRPNGDNQSNNQTELDENGNVTVDGDITADAFFESSDKRLKTNIKKISKSVYTYELKKEKGKKRYGTIAQKLEETNPELVSKPSDEAMMAVNYSDFLCMKIAEQENKTDEQDIKIEDLQSQINELKELIKNK